MEKNHFKIITEDIYLDSGKAAVILLDYIGKKYETKIYATRQGNCPVLCISFKVNCSTNIVHIYFNEFEGFTIKLERVYFDKRLNKNLLAEKEILFLFEYNCWQKSFFDLKEFIDSLDTKFDFVASDTEICDYLFERKK